MRRDDFSIVADVLFPTIIGVVAIGPIAFALWGVMIGGGIYLSRVSQRQILGLTPIPLFGSVVSATIFFGIVYAAHSYQPAKYEYQNLKRAITFPSQEMKLADAAAWASRYAPEGRILASHQLSEADCDKIIHLPSRRVTLREYLSLLEDQIGVRWKFRHCGNGYSVLGGGDCCFGLSIRQTECHGPFFDVDRYAIDHSARLTGLENRSE